MDITGRMRTLGSVVAGGKRVALALGGAVLISALLAACSGSDSGSASGDIPRVGLMHVGTDHVPPSFPALANQLRDEFGWDVPQADVDRCADVKKILKSCDIEGKDVELEWRNLEPFEADTQASVFVRQGVDVIVAFEDASIAAAQKATAGMPHPTPIVFLHPSDPVRDGLTDSLSRPDRNLTGVFGARDVVAKQLELYQLLVPKMRRVLTLVDPTDTKTPPLLAQYRAAAAGLARPLQLEIRNATTDGRPGARVPIAEAGRGRRRVPPLTEPPAQPLGADHSPRPQGSPPGAGAPQGVGRAGSPVLVRNRPRARRTRRRPLRRQPAQRA